MMMMMMIVTMAMMMTRTILFSTHAHSACSAGRRPAPPRGRVRATLSSAHVCDERERFRVAFPLSLYWTVRPGSCVR